MDIVKKIAEYKVIPVIRFDRVEDVIPTLNAIVRGGLAIAEITFRTHCARDAIATAVAQCPNVLVGAGTVINAEQANSAIDLGCTFIVAPGYCQDVMNICRDRGVLYIPGVATPTEIITAINNGLEIVKFFPAENLGGVGTLKALSSAFPSIKFMSTGGINSTNAKKYLDCKASIAVGASSMVKNELIDAKNYEEITKLTKEMMEVVNG